MANKVTAKYIEENFIGVDKAIVRKNEVEMMHGFHHFSFESYDKFIENILEQIEELGLTYVNLNTGYVDDKPFKGGAPVNNQNHYWVKATIR